MAERKSPSTTDLFLLIAGLQVVKNPDRKPDSGEDYYLNEPERTEERTLRDTEWNRLWFSSPGAAWENVRYRDWLIARLAESIAGPTPEFSAISEPPLVSMDVLSKEFTRGMAGATDAINQVLVAKSGNERSFFSALSLGLSRQKIDGKEVFTFGAGMRRRACVWLTESEALQADVEFFVPFYVVPGSDHPKGAAFPNARSICAGIAIRKSNGTAIGLDDKKELVAIRFNLRIPFTTEWRQRIKSDEYELHTEFGTPEIKIQKRVKETTQSNDGVWEKFGGWKDFVEKFCKLSEVGDLLNAPIGPLLLETISNDAGVKDIILKQSKRTEIKTDLKEVKKDLDETLDLLKNIWEWEPPKKENVGPHSSQRKLGSLLESLGFMTGKLSGGGEFEYTFKIAGGVTVWNVVDRLLDELDGFPLYVKGLSSNADKEARIALSLASQTSAIDTKRHYFGLAGLAYNIPLKTVSEKDPASKEGDADTTTIVLSGDNFTDDESILIDDEEENQEERKEETGVADKKSDAESKEKSTVEVLLHLGKWLSGETLDDNWFQRLLPKAEGSVGKQRVPLPGIRILPFKRGPVEDNSEAVFSWTLLIDLLSLGVDIKGTTKDGLKFLQGLVGHFGLGAIEVRVALKFSLEDVNVEKSFFDRVSIGIGVKLKDLRLSFGPKEEDEEAKKEKGAGDEIIEGLQKLLADDWAVVPEPKPAERNVKTRLTAKKKDKFSISVGYLSPLKKGSHGTLDIQLYDEKGNRGKMALIPIDRQLFPLYLRQIGIGLKGVENVELSKGLPDSAQLTVALTGGIRLPVFELGFIGAKLMFPLNNPRAFQFALDGLDISVKVDPVIISGSFMKVGIEYVGSLTIDLPKASFSAMGFYGSMRVFNMSRDSEIITHLNRGNVHKNLLAKLTENNLTPAVNKPIAHAYAPGEWELTTIDNKRYTVTDDDDKLNVLRMDKTFFIYAMLNAASGGGLTLGPIQFTGIAFGYGYNRRAKIPRIENVAEFPLVKMVMSEGGYQEDDTSLELRNQLAKPLEDPVSVLEKMKDHVVAEMGQQFACGGARFTIAGTVDCFALIIVQWGGGEIEISLLGLARFRHPRDLAASAICYVEMQVLMTIKPKEGSFKLQALLTNNSWIINKDCKLTGGFALFVWFGGDHKNDFVLTLGGYHPRFRRPEHYPVVPRLGLNWPVNDNLSIKGGIYFAITPSCGMLGARLEATFHSGRISAWFTAYLDVIINWSPLYFEAELGISLRVEASFFLTSIKVTIAASVQMWGPPLGFIAHIDLTVISFDIEFNPPRPKKPELIKSWQQFCHDFLNMSGGDRKAVNNPVKAFPIVQPNLAAGRNNLNSLPNARRDQSQPKREDEIWKVRADQLELACSAAVPVTSLNIGRAKTSSPSEGIQERSFSGQPMMVTKPVTLETKGLRTKNSINKLGVHPMGKTLESVLNVTMVRDEISVTHPVDLAEWILEEETGSLPAALWDAAKPNLKPSEPSAKLIEGCITGIKRLKPPSGKLGKRAEPPKIEWHPLGAGSVSKSGTSQEIPSPARTRNIQAVLTQRQDEQKKIVNALSSAGFSLAWQPRTEIRFRELQADPLAGVVAA
jgi:uncharacterized protein DUF6603